MTSKRKHGKKGPGEYKEAPGEGARSEDGSPAGDTAADTAAGTESSAFRDEIEALNSKWLRALADLDNYKKRVERDRRRWAESAREDVLLDLLDVVDNFERALACEAPAASDDSFRAGVELILKQLADVLKKNGVEVIVTDGCEFDPNVHEAVGHMESEGHDSNHVVEEAQRGYMLGDRLLRCSKVVVSK